MRNRWSDSEAERLTAACAEQGVSRDLALRVYTSRLLGREPELVLHGGGNTSVKTMARDLTGEEIPVLCVKGSGWDMAAIEPPGLPAVRLEPLRRLLALDALTDEAMVNVQRTNLLDAGAPNPSVETLLHAFLPQKYIDHTHANAVLALCDQPDGEALCRELFGDRVGYVPYVMPGFRLAKLGRQVFDAAQAAAGGEIEGLVLLKHGLFTFGETARQAYDRMIALVSLAERRVAAGPRQPLVQVTLPDRLASVATVAPILRGLAAETLDKAAGQFRRMVLAHRGGPAVLDYVNGADLARYACQGPATPDHVIRIKQKPLLLPPPRAGDLAGFRTAAGTAFARFAEAYRAYFARHNGRRGPGKIALDPMPRVILVPGLGLFGLGPDAAAAAIAADLAEANIAVATMAEGMGGYASIPEADVFDIEYWSLEQAKLGKAAEKPLRRQVAAVTGGASGIGAATVRAFAAEGAEVAVLDKDEAGAAAIAGETGGLGLACDVTDAASVTAAFDRIAEQYGGLDILVSNAGAAWQGRIGEVDEAVLQASFALNFWGHQRAAQAAVAIMQAQGTGGCLLFNVSKQAVNPGRDFGPYGLPKAAALFLMRQYALDHGGDGIRANAVNADRIRSGLVTEEMIAERARARGIGPEDYLRANLLRREARAADVAQAFLHLAKAPATSAAVLTVDGGNIEAALR